jgi:hypothetical protein
VAYEAAADPENAIALDLAHQLAGRLDQAYAVMAEAEPKDVAKGLAIIDEARAEAGARMG